MICATIGRGRHNSLVEEWQAAADAGAELVELRIDCLRREPDLKRIFKQRPTPMVFTIRRGADGGMWRGQEEKRQQLLREAIALGVDYVDLESDVAGQIRRFGKTKRIVSYHNLKGTPGDLNSIAEQCATCDPDVVKVATAAHGFSDAARVLRLGATFKKHPTVAIAMGEAGVFTRILGAKFGAPFTYSGFNPERIFAAGMLTFASLKNDYAYDQINAETEVYGVIGDPIGHSLSPAIHNAGFRQLGLNKVMAPFQVAAGDLDAFFEELEWVGVKGCSVTIPHKVDVIAQLDHKDASVEQTGSCNTVSLNDDGTWTGYNTDYQAAIESLEAAMGKTEGSEGSSPLLEKQVLILGAGGVARSLAFGVARQGATVTITNRHDERASTLAEEVGCRTVNWSLRASTIADVVINCTPVGMHPNVDDTPMPPAAFQRPKMVVFDTIYHPENTMLLKLARERECITLTGADMFIKQAALQFKIYTGAEAPVDLMKTVLKRKLGSLREA